MEAWVGVGEKMGEGRREEDAEVKEVAWGGGVMVVAVKWAVQFVKEEEWGENRPKLIWKSTWKTYILLRLVWGIDGWLGKYKSHMRHVYLCQIFVWTNLNSLIDVCIKTYLTIEFQSNATASRQWSLCLLRTRFLYSFLLLCGVTSVLLHNCD